MNNSLPFEVVIRNARLAKGYSLKDLCNHLGGSPRVPYLSMVECRGVIPRPALLLKLADLLGIDRTELIILAKDAQLSRYRSDIGKRYATELNRYLSNK